MVSVKWLHLTSPVQLTALKVLFIYPLYHPIRRYKMVDIMQTGIGARSEFWGVASRVPWGWCDSYGKTGNCGRVGDKSMFKMYKKPGVG